MLVVSTLFLWVAMLSNSDAILTIAFLDVGQGDSIYIESPSGNQVLIDGGRNRAVLRQLGSIMPFYDRSIDVVIATHPDSDHIGGLPDVFSRFSVSTFIEPGSSSTSGVFHEMMHLADLEGSTHILARRGQTIDMGDGAYIRIIFPDRDVSGLESNNSSVIAQVVYGETEVMLTGDAGSSIERYVVSLEGSRLHSDILKAGHHGSKTSSDQQFVSVVDPDYVIISAGLNNRYGHPHAEVIDRFRDLGATILSTYESGMLVFTSTGMVLKRVD